MKISDIDIQYIRETGLYRAQVKEDYLLETYIKNNPGAWMPELMKIIINEDNSISEESTKGSIIVNDGI